MTVFVIRSDSWQHIMYKRVTRCQQSVYPNYSALHDYWHPL